MIRGKFLWLAIIGWGTTAPAAAQEMRFGNTLLFDMMLTGKDRMITEPVIKGITYLTVEGETRSVPETDVLRYLEDRYPGKVIYIDVYATWCGPCLEEMRYTPALHEEMKGKDVVFVNLCPQSAVSNWTVLVRKRSIGGENYFFTDDATKLFMGTYKLSGYPSYLLMNRQGGLITTSAPRPSEAKAVKETLLKLLEE
ncbi:TlpA family protein disulfide reductase [Leadbetterella sp. DM7]|uniref:TlpA family protein disulfide reductase n=1 Tax=Leadbetterella sp. DM7 TaxID=3235085 RepID=UPI00349E9001